MSQRKIIHIDMDAFYASIEQRDHPEYRGKPLAVGRGEARGVVSTASYEARKFGIHSAMPSLKALQLCPKLIFVPGRMEVYKSVSTSIREIFHRYTDIIEPLSFDEAFLDVTDNKLNIPLAVDIARLIRADIQRELHLTASAGISYNKFLAKIASDYRKPNGMCTIHPSQADNFIARLPIETFWGVGKATATRMHAFSIKTGADLRARDKAFLIRQFGKMGLLYYDFARGIDERPVESTWIRKSVGCERTFDIDIERETAMNHELIQVIDELIGRISRSGFQGNTLTLKLKFPDFTQRTKSITVPDTLTELESIFPLAQSLLAEIETNDRPFRLLGLSVSNPKDENIAKDWEQLWLNLE
ncbi:MAG: DNA polymerase IV [Akkermansia sp.]